MKAIILIGGKGTRLRPLTYTVSKVNFLIVNTPFLDRLIKRLEKCGVKDIIFAIHYLSTDIMQYLNQIKNNYNVNIKCSIEPQPLGSGGALKFNEKYIDDSFLLLNGDILTDLDYSQFFSFHNQKNALVSVNTSYVEDPSRFGVITSDENDQVTCWQEKPDIKEAKSKWVNVGVWAMKPEILNYIPENRFVSLETEVLQNLVKDKKEFYAFKSDNYWIDIGTKESFIKVNKDILMGKINEPINHSLNPKENVWIGEACQISDNTKLNEYISVGKQTQILNNSIIEGPSVIGSNCTINENANISNSILWDNVIIGNNTVIKNSIIGNNVNISENSQIIDSVIADNSTIKAASISSFIIGPDSNI